MGGLAAINGTIEISGTVGGNFFFNVNQFASMDACNSGTTEFNAMINGNFVDFGSQVVSPPPLKKSFKK